MIRRYVGCYFEYVACILYNEESEHRRFVMKFPKMLRLVSKKIQIYKAHWRNQFWNVKKYILVLMSWISLTLSKPSAFGKLLLRVTIFFKWKFRLLGTCIFINKILFIRAVFREVSISRWLLCVLYCLPIKFTD